MLVKLLTTRAKRAVTDSLTFALPKVRVKVNQGVVRGVLEKLPDGRKFQRFSCIPYAKPPVGDLRFKSPQKLLKFDQDENDCTREKEGCFHKSMIWRKFQGSEDCLYLNVYVPTGVDSSQKLPVMVFIHGGGFIFDNSSRDFYSPEYLLMENVIVVTVNYRLHAFGFLSLPSMGISGNAALKDQQMALEWVNENIPHFNGDNEKVCIFGSSAGAACCHLHVLNEKSRKFFRNAILQSNNAMVDWLYQKDGEDKTRRLAKDLGSKGNSDQDHFNALMSASTEKIFVHNWKVADPKEVRRQLPFVFKPIFEKESEDAFLTRDPAQLIKNSKINKSMMLGMVNGDGMTMGNFYRQKSFPLFDSDNVKLVPISLNIDPMSDEAEKLGREIREFYFGDKKIDNNTLQEFVDFMNDFHFTVPQTMTNELHALHQPADKQFVFEFCYDGELNIFKELLNMTELPGACHSDEIFYMFDAKIIGRQVPVDSPAYKMRTKVCKMWTNFARHDDPTPENNNPLSISWKPIDPKINGEGRIDVNYLRIDEKFEMKQNMNKDRIDFWRKIYQKYNSGLLNPQYR